MNESYILYTTESMGMHWVQSVIKRSRQGFVSWPCTAAQYIGQVVHTCVPLSLSSIIWYWPKNMMPHRK